MNRILITGALGQLGTALSQSLSHDPDNFVLATDIRKPIKKPLFDFIQGDILDYKFLVKLIIEYEIHTIYHLVSVLSANAEHDPFGAWNLNMQSFQNIARLGIDYKIKRIFWPSSIAVYGKDKNPIPAPQQTDMNPETIYGITKLAGEKLMNYYKLKYGLDIRSIRLPGVISINPAGGGTTDYVVDMLTSALNKRKYICYLSPNTRLPMIYIEDAINAIKILMKTNFKNNKSVYSYNVMGYSLTPKIWADSIINKGYKLEVKYKPDYRQLIADGWPQTVDDKLAKLFWGWTPKYNIERTLSHILR